MWICLYCNTLANNHPNLAQCVHSNLVQFIHCTTIKCTIWNNYPSALLETELQQWGSLPELHLLLLKQFAPYHSSQVVESSSCSGHRIHSVFCAHIVQCDAFVVYLTLLSMMHFCNGRITTVWCIFCVVYITLLIMMHFAVETFHSVMHFAVDTFQSIH